jgi:hypothetical protein
MNDPIQYQAVQEKRFPWGCLLGGCLSVMLLVVIGIGASIYAGMSFYYSQVNKYTASQPAVLPIQEYTEEQSDAVQKRFDDFKAALEKGETPEALVLTADDINALLSQVEELKGKIYVSIEDGEISAQASFPADFVPGGKGRFFNGRISLKASLENGILIVNLEDAEVNGEPVPEQFLSGMREENLAKDAYKDKKTVEFLRKFEKLTIEDDKIILVPAKPKPTSEEENKTETPQAEVSELPM